MRWYKRVGMFLRSLVLGPSGWLTLETHEIVGPDGGTRVEEWLYDSWGHRLPATRDSRGRLLCPGCGSPLVAEGGRMRHGAAQPGAQRTGKKRKKKQRKSRR